MKINYQKTYKTLILYGSLIVGMVFAFISSTITTRYLDPGQYGNYKTVITIWSLIDVLINFGFFHSAGQVLLKEEQEIPIREIIGSIILIVFILGAIMAILLLIISKPIDMIFKINISSILVLLAPFIITYPLKGSLTLILQSTNKIYLLSVVNFLPSILLLIYLLIWPQVSKNPLTNILFGQQSTLLITEFAIIIIIKPIFNNIKKWTKKILGKQKIYGSPVYIASICSVAMQYINRLSIVYWVDSQSIGFFSLASQLVEPIRLIPSSVATSSFRDFANKEKISRRRLLITIIISISTLLAFLVLLDKPLSWFFTAQYADHVGPLSKALAFGALILGIAELFNRFLGAHGQGKALKSSAFVVGAVYLLGFFVLTPKFGVWGTVVATILANTVNLFLMLYFYFQYRRKVKDLT